MNKQTIANLLTQPGGSFPLDCETVDAIQNNMAVIQAALGNITGGDYIIYGCAPSGGTTCAPGYIFLHTRDFPDGEILYWEGGDVSGGMHLHKESVKITAYGVEYPQAYTIRSLRPGTGDESYAWPDVATTLRQILDLIKIERDRITNLAGDLSPVGSVQLWAGKLSELPRNYLVCDGRELPMWDYLLLYEVLGTNPVNPTSQTILLPNLPSPASGVVYIIKVKPSKDSI